MLECKSLAGLEPSEMLDYLCNLLEWVATLLNTHTHKWLSLGCNPLLHTNTYFHTYGGLLYFIIEII